MDDHVELPTDNSSEPSTVTDGFFEREVQLSRDQTATFLRELADQIETGTNLTVSTSDWEIPFTYDEPIEVEVEFTGGRESELEIELEFTEATTNGDLSVH